MTASFGTADFRRGQVIDFNRLMVQADAALYSEKTWPQPRRNRAGRGSLNRSPRKKIPVQL